MTIPTLEAVTTPVVTAPGGPASDRPPSRRSSRLRGSGWWPVLFVGPFFAGIVVFYLFPIVQTAYFSFTTWGTFGGSTFTGLANWRHLVTDPQIPSALLNTSVYVAVVLLGVPIAVVLASILNRPGLRLTSLYRALLFMPYLTMPVAVSVVWRLMFNGDYGIIDSVLGALGGPTPRWLSTPGLAIVAVSIVGLWFTVGFDIVILSAGLRGIPPELYEAAGLDGASRLVQFRNVTVPLLTPSIFFVTVINVIGGFQLFDLLYAIIGQTNPTIAESQSLVYLFYNESFVQGNRGYGAAIAILILAIVAIVTLVQFRLQRRWVNYV